MPDRYGEPDPPACRDPRCRKGWLGTDDEQRPIPCPACKPHLAVTRSDVHDYAEREPSARARAAIERENQQ